jgi:glycosyltransferase involved in cell wall biosynthesis
MSDLKVSIIIPIYNSINFIAATLASIDKQTCKRLEVLVIDDNSTDGSFEFVKGLKKENLILKKNKGKGACAARNYGFELATGDYIQYLDADDILSPNKIKAQLELAQLYGKETVYSCSWLHFHASIQDVKIKRQPIDKDYANPREWLSDSWMGKGMGQTSIWLTHRSLIEKSGGWNESLKINQDGEFFSRIILASQGVKFSDNALVYYRRGNSNSISQANTYSEEKASSLLMSYVLYKNNAQQFDSLEELRRGLAHNFLIFIYQYYDYFPKLVQNAKHEFYSLGFSKMWPVGGAKFRNIAHVIGFQNTLKIKNFIKF